MSRKLNLCNRRGQRVGRWRVRVSRKLNLCIYRPRVQVPTVWCMMARDTVHRTVEHRTTADARTTADRGCPCQRRRARGGPSKRRRRLGQRRRGWRSQWRLEHQTRAHALARGLASLIVVVVVVVVVVDLFQLLLQLLLEIALIDDVRVEQDIDDLRVLLSRQQHTVDVR